MGEFTGGKDVHAQANIELTGTEQQATGAEGETQTQELPGFETDVADVRADDMVKQGTNEFPCFDVDQNEFYQNMTDGRKRLRFKTGSNAQKYMAGTKYNRPFYIRTKDGNGKSYVRKIK